MSDAQPDDDGDLSAAELRAMEQLNAFLEALAGGSPRDLAGWSVGWTPRKIRSMETDPATLELIEAAEDRNLDTIEQKLSTMARAGNIRAAEMILYNRRPNRWRDVRKIEVSGTVQHSIGDIETAKMALISVLREAGVAALQPALAAADIVDAEVISDEPAD